MINTLYQPFVTLHILRRDQMGRTLKENDAFLLLFSGEKKKRCFSITEIVNIIPTV
uniref:Uncharacterized protein n=1 Tax=Rhizophora mucronata TaxID=61149 RepID=A0A2P2Q197_RHIMU